MNPYRKPDFYAKKAKQENYVARSVFKLMEIDQSYHLTKGVKRALDLGASPGSWSQYLLKKGIQILAIDRNPLRISENERLYFLQADLNDLRPEELKQNYPDFFPIDLVVSDMAPSTTGHRLTDQLRSLHLCELAFHFAQSLLKPSGHFVCKIFEGGELPQFRRTLQNHFAKVLLKKPKATRSCSKELFLVCFHFKGFHSA
jgi:23S rRNA (uridine2552-2'-O)-methyltransferase